MSSRPLPPWDLEIELRVLTRDEGGQQRHPIRAGILLPAMIREDMTNDGRYDFEDTEWLWPGESTHASVRFLRPDLRVGRLAVGATYRIGWEWHRIAHARVLGVGRQELLRGGKASHDPS
jgi:hypothetical protein